jgi:flagellin-like hook-associated protein FlgL
MSVLSSGSIVSGFLVRYLNSATFDVERIEKRLLRGEREGDAVRIGMANQFDVEALTGSAAISNLNDGISYLTIADSALEIVGSLLSDVQAIMDDALSTTDAATRDSLNQEANDLISQANDIISSATFGDRSIFFGESSSINLIAGRGNSGSFQVTVGDGASLMYGSVDIRRQSGPTLRHLWRRLSYGEE